MWDVRVQRSVRSIFGPYICGRGLSAAGGVLVTASWRKADALQAWDIGSGELITNLPCQTAREDALKLYAVSHCDGDTVLTGGASAAPGLRVRRSALSYRVAHTCPPVLFSGRRAG